MNGLKECVRLLLTCVLLGHMPADARQAGGVSDLWMGRALSLAEELVKDADALDRYDRALLLARLGKTWQQEDAGRAGSWIEKALQAVESAPDDEGADGRGRRLRAARSLLLILGAQDREASARLNKVISTSSDPVSAQAPDPGNAKAKAEAGIAVVESDPQRALQLGLASLRDGGSYKLASLIWRLRKRDVKASESLFKAVVAAARANNYRHDLLAILPTVAFEGPEPSDELRGLFLTALAEGLLRIHGPAEEQSAPCGLASTAAPLLPEFQRLLPQQAAMVRAQIGRCQTALASSERRDVEAVLQESPLNTVEELLSAAGKTSDAERRVDYLRRAASKASEEQNYERGAGILDGFNGAERELTLKATGSSWDTWRSDLASAAAVARLGQGDRPGMYRVISDTPAHLRASVQMAVAAQLLKKDAPAAGQLLDEARMSLAKGGAHGNFGSYLLLTRLYATLGRADATLTLSEAVKAMREAERGNRDAGADHAEAQIPLLSNDLLLGRYGLPAALLEIDETGVRQIISSLDSPARRAAMRLSLLRASLERHHAGKPKSLPETKGQADATP